VGTAHGQTVRAQRYGGGAVVLKPEHHTAALGIDGHPQQPLFGVRLGCQALHGIVQRHAHQGADLPGGQKAQPLAVGHAGHVDALLLTLHALGREEGVQHRVARFVLRLILADAALHPGQRRVLLGLVALGTDVGDLDFQLVVAAVDELDALLAPLVLLVLAVEHLVHGFQLAVQGTFPQLVVLDGQDQHAAEIHQRPDIVDAHVHFAIVQKEQVAHRKNHGGHHHGYQRSLVADCQLSGRAGAAAFQPEHRPVQHAIDNDQKEQGQPISPAPVREQRAVELPLHAGGQFRQNKCPGADIACFQPADIPAGPQVQIREPDGRRHAGDPPGQRHAACRVQEYTQGHGPSPGQHDCGPFAEPPRQRPGVEQDRHAFSQRRVQAGDVRQRRHTPSPPM